MKNTVTAGRLHKNSPVIRWCIRTALALIVVVLCITGLKLALLSPSQTVHHENVVQEAAVHESSTAPSMAPAPYESSTASTVVTAIQTPLMQLHTTNTRAELEDRYDINIIHIHPTFNIPQEACDTIIKITNRIDGMKILNTRGLASISKEVSDEHNTVTIENLGDFITLKVTVNGESYVLKSMSRMYKGNANDMLAAKFDSPYIMKVLLAFSNDGSEWMLTEHAGSEVCAISGINCTKEEVSLMVHDVLEGLKYIHSTNHVHGDLHRYNIVAVRDATGKTLGYKIIDFGLGHAKDCSKLTSEELLEEVKGISLAILDYITDRFNTRPANMPYLLSDVRVDKGDPISFLEDDLDMFDFFVLFRGMVEHPPTNIAELMQHHYITGKKYPNDIFGRRAYTLKRIVPELGEM